MVFWHFDYLDVDSVIQEQKAFGACRDVTLEYPVAENEGEEDNTYLSYNMVVGNAADSQMAMAFEVLDYALLSAPGAPLKQALLDVKASIFLFPPHFIFFIAGSFHICKISIDPAKNIHKQLLLFFGNTI